MSNWIRIADSSLVTNGQGATVTVDAIKIAVFRDGDSWYAIEDTCPHQGASLGTGSFDGKSVSCPLHNWNFDVATGQSDRGASVLTISVRCELDSVWLDKDTLPSKSHQESDHIYRYLIRYGAPGWVGLFGTVHELDVQFKDQVVVQTCRGLELGEVLTTPADPKTQQNKDKPTGELLRLAQAKEISEHRITADQLVPRLLKAGQTELDQNDLPVDVIDCELLLDQEKAILYYLGNPSPVLTDLRETLAAQCQVKSVEWQSIIEQPSGCGGGGGCSSGGCGSAEGCGSEGTDHMPAESACSEAACTETTTNGIG